MDSSGGQTNGLVISDNAESTNAPSDLSLASVMADQYIGFRHFLTLEDARADRASRARCAPVTDDLDAVKSSEDFWLNKILESFIRVLSHDPEKPNCIKQSESAWRNDVQTAKDDIYSKVIESGRISHQAEKAGKILLQEVYWLHESGWHVDLWKPDKFRKVKEQYYGMQCTDRLNAICDVLSTCAPLVCDVLDGKNLERFVGSPGFMVGEKHQFRQSNLRRKTTKEDKAAKENAAETTENPNKKRKNTAQRSPVARISTPTASPIVPRHHGPSLLPSRYPFTPPRPSFTQSLPRQTNSHYAAGPPATFPSMAGNSTEYGGNLVRHDSAVDWSQAGYYGAGNETNTGGFSFSVPPFQPQYQTGFIQAARPSYGWGATSYSGGNENIDWNEPIDEYE